MTGLLGLLGGFLSTVLSALAPAIGLALIGAALWAASGAILAGWERAKRAWFGLKPAGRAARRLASRALNGPTGPPASGTSGTSGGGPAGGRTGRSGSRGRAGAASTSNGTTTVVEPGTTTSTGTTATATDVKPSVPRPPRRITPEHVATAHDRIDHTRGTGEQHGLATATAVRGGASYVAGFKDGVRAGFTPRPATPDAAAPDDARTDPSDPPAEPATTTTPDGPDADVIPWKRSTPVTYQTPSEIPDLATLSTTMDGVVKELGAGEDLSAEIDALSKLAEEAATLSEKFGRDMGQETTTQVVAFQESAGQLAQALRQVGSLIEAMSGAAQAVKQEAETTRGDAAA